jgi:hypothetical protein
MKRITVAVVLLCWSWTMLGQDKFKEAPPSAAPAPIIIGELDHLKLDGLKKDVIIANQQVQIIQAQLLGAQAQNKMRADTFWTAVSELRTRIKASEAEYDFDAEQLKFTPKKLKKKTSPKPVK